MRKALIGLLTAATAITPIASAYAQDNGRWHREVQQQSQDSNASNDVQRSWERYERKAEQYQSQNQGSEAPRHGVEGRRNEQQAPQVQQAPQQAEPHQWNRGQSQSDRGEGSRTFRRREAPQFVQPQQQVQPQQWSRERWRSDPNRAEGTRTYDRRTGDGNRSWDRNQTSNGDRTWDRTRSGDGNRTWDRNRSGSWNGRTYSWNRDGRNYSWNHDWRNSQRYDWQDYRRYNRNIFHVGSYYAPYYGYRYRRFSIGFFLEPLFFSQNYWVSDPWYYRLPPAPPGTRWIRYYDDVLLVDMYSGEVIDVINDFFW
jgi:hypothetical protein